MVSLYVGEKKKFEKKPDKSFAKLQQSVSPGPQSRPFTLARKFREVMLIMFRPQQAKLEGERGRRERTVPWLYR